MSDLYFRNSRVRSQSTKDGMLLFNLMTGKGFHCNETAEMAWRALDDNASLEDLVRYFHTKFSGVPEGSLQEDLQSMLKIFESNELVRRMPQDS